MKRCGGRFILAVALTLIPPFAAAERGAACPSDRAPQPLTSLLENLAHGRAELREELRQMAEHPHDDPVYRAAWVGILQRHTTRLDILAQLKTTGRIANVTDLIDLIEHHDVRERGEWWSLLEIMTFAVRHTPVDASMFAGTFQRVFEAIEEDIAADERLASVVPDARHPSRAERVRLEEARVVFADITGSADLAEMAIVNLGQLRQRGDIANDALAHYLEGYAHSIVGRLRRSPADLEQAISHFGAALEVYGVNCHVQRAAEIAVALARTQEGIADLVRQEHVAQMRLGLAVHAIEQAQRFASPLDAPVPWRNIYLYSAELYERAARTERGHQRQRLLLLAERALEVASAL